MQADDTQNPYVGPRPFERADASRFFGRAREIRDVVSLVVAQRIVLLYSASGAGKSSLLNAGVIPLLESEKGFDVLPVCRVRADEPPPDGNVFVAGLLASLGTNVPGLAVHLTSRRDQSEARLRALVIDQFEELFTSHPGHWQERPAFFHELREALERDTGLRLVLAIREDFLAELDPFAALLPGGLRTRFRLERLDRPNALAAIEKPLERTGRRFAPGAAETLVDDLRQVRLGTGTAAETIVAEYVEPVQLQVACRSLWTDLPPTVTEITEDHLEAYADVDQILIRFYDDAVAAAAARSTRREGRIRAWIEGTLITAGGTRGAAYAGEDEAAGLPMAIVSALEGKRLIRPEWRANARWFELTHDRLIDPIKTSNARFASRARATKVRRGAIALTIAVASVALFAGFGLRSSALAPDGTFASLSLGTLRPNVTRLTYLEGIGQPVGSHNDARRGNIIPFQLATDYRGTAEFRVNTFDVATRRLGPRTRETRLVTAARTRASIWVELPREDGDYAYDIWMTIGKGDDAQIIRVRSRPFTITRGATDEGAIAVGLALTVSGPGSVLSFPSGINCGSNCSAMFAAATTVKLIAQPGPAAQFRGWRGGCSGTALVCKIRTGAVSSVAAVFRLGGLSTKGRQIRVIGRGDPDAATKILVFGCTHGTECAGRAIAERLTKKPTPAGVAVWIVPNLNPDGLLSKTRTNARGVNLNRNFPWSWGESASRRPDEYPGKRALSEPETRFAHDLIRLLKPTITIWYHQTPREPYVVYATGTSAEIPRRYANLSGVGERNVHRQDPPPGSATGWQRAAFPGATAFFVELPDGDALPAAVVERHASAVLALARSIATTK